MIKKIVIGWFALLLCAGCSKQLDGDEQQKSSVLKIYTTTAPLHFACRQLVGDQDLIINTCPVGEDEPEYVPERSVLVEMVYSDLIIHNGAFENWMKAVSLPDSKIFDCTANYKDDWLMYQGSVHSHGGQADHSHKGFNGHTWIAPYYFEKQCTAIYEKLKTLLPPEEQEKRNLAENYKKLQEQLIQLNEQGTTVFAPVKGTLLAATHPTFDYVAKSYGFEIFNVDIAPDEAEVTETVQKQLDLLKQKKEERGLMYLFWEEEPNEVIGKAISDLGLINLVFPPICGMDAPDYISGMTETFEKLGRLISGETIEK